MTTPSFLDHVVPLLEQLRVGEPAAFGVCVRQYQGLVRAYLSRHVRSAETVDDLAQETFLTAFRRLETYQGRVSLAGWLLGIARNLALHHLRGEVRRQRRENARLAGALVRWQTGRIEADEPEEFEAELSALRNCLNDLPPHSREMVQAFYFAERSAEQIAVEAGKRAGTMRMMLLSIRRILSECIQRRLGREAQP